MTRPERGLQSPNEHPTLFGRPVMIGSRLLGDDPDAYAEDGPVEFIVSAIVWDHSVAPGCGPDGPPIGWTFMNKDYTTEFYLSEVSWADDTTPEPAAPIDTAEMRATAQAAADGRMERFGLKFMAASNPHAVLALLDALDTANAEVARLTAALEAAEQRWTTSVWERLQTALSELEVTVLGGGEDAAGTDAEVREVAERVVEAFLAWWDASPTPGPQTGSEVMTEKDRIRSEVAKLRAEVEAAKAAPGPPVCEVCDLTEDYAHHVAQGTKGYHPFAPRTEGGA